MKWIKKGLLFSAENKNSLIKYYAQVPVILLKKDFIRVYFSTRQKQDISMITFVDIDKNNLENILYVHDKPILDLGEEGMFDEFGLMPSSIIEKDGRIFLYYSGWSRGVNIPYNNYTGLAISDDDGKTFKKYSKGPIIDRTPFELYSATSPCVYYEDTKWHMYYSSGTYWHKINDKYEHTYEIKYAFSEDGIKWIQTNKSVIKQKTPYEAITKPSIIKINNIYHMWYCYRGSEDFRNGKDAYNIGYAYSSDLLSWTRDDLNAGIKLSNQGWDDKMQAYPDVKKINDKIFMFYNGNNFGKSGFGYAMLDLEKGT